MEILDKFKKLGYFTYELYHLLEQKKLVEYPEDIIPSEYLKEMQMSPTERLQNLNSIMVDNIIPTAKDPRPLLAFTPRVLIFQNFKAKDRIVGKFCVKNISQAPVYLSIVPKESTSFLVRRLASGQPTCRLAPGITLTFSVTFLPSTNQDCMHEVLFHTEKADYVIMLIGMAPRPLLDLPDEIRLPHAPLKMETHYLLTVRNIGEVGAQLSFSTKCPFSIKPKSLYLNEGESGVVKVMFKTMRLGEIRGFLYAELESGELLKICLYGATFTVSIRLEKQLVRFGDTFNNLVRQQTLKITNNSEHTLTYMCMKNDCVYYDFEEKLKLATIFNRVKENECDKYKKLAEYDVLSSEEHQRVYTRIFLDEIQALVADETLTFHNTHFLVTPISGKLWPNTVTELTITYCPKEIGPSEAITYLDVDGVFNRIPLKMTGKSMPPDIVLSVETLNMSCVYINKEYFYEIVATNKGHINGVVEYREMTSLFGSRIKCTPRFYCLKPGDKETFVISFCNSNQGAYFDEVNFIIRDTNVVLKLYLKGEIIYPTLSFSVPCLDFGVVCLGVPKIVEFDVINESGVHVSAALKITSDGPEESSMTLTDYAVADLPKPRSPKWPKEFTIVPKLIVVDPESKFTVRVELTANLIRQNYTALEMELDNSDSPPILLPVKFDAKIPELTRGPNIKIRDCFLDFPYEYTVDLLSNDLIGYFSVVEPETNTGLEVDVKVKQGLIEANSTVSIPLVIKTSVLGAQEYSLRFQLFGLSEPVEVCHILACGVRPIVTCHPIALHWGQLKLLTKSTKTLTLINDSPCHVTFKASLLYKDGRWKISPAEGVIEPGSEMDFAVDLYLVDADTFYNKAVIQLENVKDIIVPLTVTGTGTSIRVGGFEDSLPLGRYFTNLPFSIDVIMTNCGTRVHTLEWTESFKQAKTKKPTRADKPQPVQVKTFFNLEPRLFKMEANEETTLVISGISHKMGIISEVWYLIGNVEGVNKKELLLECKVSAEFVDPVIEVFPMVVELRYDSGPYSEFYKLTDDVVIKNVSRLPLMLDITVKPPFAMIEEQLNVDESNVCTCCTTCCENNELKAIDSSVEYKPSKTYIDCITHKPVDPVRHQPLNLYSDINKIKKCFTLTHSIEKYLLHKESYKVVLVFDTTKHTSLRSKMYMDLMKIKFRGHKNKDAVKLIGRVNLPNVQVNPSRLDFQCIPNGGVKCMTLNIINVTPLLVCYKFQWKKCSVTIVPPQLPEISYSLDSAVSESSIILKSTTPSPLSGAVAPEATIEEIIYENEHIAPVVDAATSVDIVLHSVSSETRLGSIVMSPEVNMIHKLATMLTPDYDKKFEWLYKFPKPRENTKYNINDYLFLIPHRGLLRPNEKQNVNVIFKPQLNTTIKAIIECNVLGGCTETIIVTAQSADLRYEIESNKVSFGIRSFQENACETLYLKNTGPLAFEYKTYLNEPKFNTELEATILHIEPSESFLLNSEYCDIKIVMRPGAVGYYERRFLIEIGHLPAVPIEICGWGVIPQMYIALDRPSIKTLGRPIGYEAIAALTIEYLDEVNKMFLNSPTAQLESDSPNIISAPVEEIKESASFLKEWHICSFTDGYPSVIDIELAIERYLVIKYFERNPEIVLRFTQNGYLGSIPGYVSLPYVLDFGVVITDSQVHRSIDLINYGPMASKLYLTKGTKLPIWLDLKLCGKLAPGEVRQIEVTFSPTSEVFTKLEQDVKVELTLEMSCGVVLPMTIMALCAVPYLATNVSSIDFGTVKCGNKATISIPLKNIGKPTCIWYVTMKMKTSGPNPLTISDTCGEYEPGKGGIFTISFKPTMECLYEGALIFKFFMNPTKLVIPVRGHGISPHIHIIGPEIVFLPTLPWSETTEIYFGITNPCPFPIELIFAHSDEGYKLEDEVLALLNKYYDNPEEMLVPAITPGKGLPQECVNFFKYYNDRLQRAITAEHSAATAAAKASTSRKPQKSPKSAKKGMATPSVKEVIKSRIFRTDAEVISDEIQAMKAEGIDPIHETMAVFQSPSSAYLETETHARGVLIFFHGSPHEEMQGKEMASNAAKYMKLPLVNIDSAIVEALCDLNTDARRTILSALIVAYKAAYVPTNPDELEKNDSPNSLKNDKDRGDSDQNKEAFDYLDNDEEDENQLDESFDSIWNMVHYLANIVPPQKVTDKKKSRSTTSTAAAAPSAGSVFNVELMHTMLMEYFALPKFNKGFIVDSLTSIIIKTPQNALISLLRYKPNIHNVHLVLCHSDFAKWVAEFEEKFIKELETLEESGKPSVIETRDLNEVEIAQIVAAVEEMDDAEYENTSEVFREVYVRFGLNARRRKYEESHGITSSLKDTRKSTKDPSRNTNESTVDVKKKAKKDDGKNFKQTPEYISMNHRYQEYMKNTYDSLVTVACNWLREENELATPLRMLNGQVVGPQKKPGKKSAADLHVLSEQGLEDRGFPLTLVMGPCVRYKRAVTHMLANLPAIKQALDIEEEEDVLRLPPQRREYTVLQRRARPVVAFSPPLQWRYLQEPLISHCECNQVTELQYLDDSTQENVLNILSKWHCVCGKKVATIHTSTSEFMDASSTAGVSPNSSTSSLSDPGPAPVAFVQASEACATRPVLAPGDLMRCKFTYNPTDEGYFSLQRFVEISGWADSRLTITAKAICDIPRLDSRPKKMFKNFVRSTVEDKTYKLTYLNDRKCFEFGPIFIGNNRVYEEQYVIELRNSSLITAETDIQFMYESPVFILNTYFISLEPGARGNVTVTAAPAIIGEHINAILFCVKDNPEVVAVNLSCTGVVPVVDILPTSLHINYGKVLLYRREVDRFIVKNESVLPILWRVQNPEEFAQDFILASTSGVVPCKDNQVVRVQYVASRVAIISDLPLIIDIYEERGRGDPMLAETVHFSAECYDAMVECAFENPSESFLNYGNVKVNSTVVCDLYLLNRGKYSVYYKLTKVANFPEPALLKSFEYESSGVIPASLRLVTVEMACTPRAAVTLSRVPAFTCTLLDGGRRQAVVAEFPVCVSIASFYNTFTLFPLGELNCHVIPVGTSITCDVIITNTSKCPIIFEILVPLEYRVPSPADADATPPPPTHTKKQDKKIKHPGINCGNFTILNEDILLEPGASRTIPIQFFAAEAKSYEETIKFVVSDVCPAEAAGVPLRLVGAGAVPTLDLWNTDNTFREHLILHSLQDYKSPECSPHCVFVEDSFTLYFFSVTVNTSHTAALDLYNSGLVPCALTMRLSYQSNTDASIFYLDKYDTHVESLMHRNLNVVFAPKELKEYRAVLEVKVKQSENKYQIFNICLIGSGEIPRIEMIRPRISRQKVGVMRLPVTCLGSISDKFIKFKNISTVLCRVLVRILQRPPELKKVYWLTVRQETDKYSPREDSSLLRKVEVVIKPGEIATVALSYFPDKKGRTNCDIKISIADNPYESFQIFCQGEAFMEDVVLLGLTLLSLEADDLLDHDVGGSLTDINKNKEKISQSTGRNYSAKKEKSGSKKKKSQTQLKSGDKSNADIPVLKYLLDIGGCPISSLQKRTIIMTNNSEKVYRFTWEETDNIKFKPSMGYISPAEEKDIEVNFFSSQNIYITMEALKCQVVAIRNDILTLDSACANWDSRQTATLFQQNPNGVNERYEDVVVERPSSPEPAFGVIHIVLLFSATAEYTKFHCDLPEVMKLQDTFIYQTRKFDFKLKNTGKVDLRVEWCFNIDEEYPSRIDKKKTPVPAPENTEASGETETGVETEQKELEPDESKMTLYSCNSARESVDTWFEADLPFTIEPRESCMKPDESTTFTVTFAPLECFKYKVRLISKIENLDPYDQNVSCKVSAKSLIPYCYLDMEQSDYLSAGRRQLAGVQPPPQTNVMEFSVLGYGCYKKTLNIMNPTSSGYEWILEWEETAAGPALVPVHCDPLKGQAEGGTSSTVTFTFAPTGPGLYESYWRLLVPEHSLVLRLLVVGIVREPQVMFVPTILIIRNAFVGFTSASAVVVRNAERQRLRLEYRGNSLPDESGRCPVKVLPETGWLRPLGDTTIKIMYTPIDDGPLSFKIYFNVTYLTKPLTLCVNALSFSIAPKVTYLLIGNEHTLSSDALTNIHLDDTASTYERQIEFKIKNEGSATFYFEWRYSCRNVRRYLQVELRPRCGHVAAGAHAACVLHFQLRQLPVKAFPLELAIKDGPQYNLMLHAELKKPLYRMSCSEHDFGMCVVNTPDKTYRKMIAIFNNDDEPITFFLNFTEIPELFVEYEPTEFIQPKNRVKLIVYFRPKQVQKYEINLQFWINTLCEENIVIRGEGVPLLFDLYEGCQKSFNLGRVKVGEKVVREIQVMNHTKVAINAKFEFQDINAMAPEGDDVSLGPSICLKPSHTSTGMSSQSAEPSRGKLLQLYKASKSQRQAALDAANTQSALRVEPAAAALQPHQVLPLRIHFTPRGQISKLDAQLNMVVWQWTRALVRLSGCAVDTSVELSRRSLQFGRVRRGTCRRLRVMLINRGDCDAKFCWEPLFNNEFTIEPSKGDITAQSNVTFTVSFRPKHYNPFIKLWALCNVSQHAPLELALHAACGDTGLPAATRALRLECAARDSATLTVPIVNPTDDQWIVTSELADGAFETLEEFHVEAKSTFEVPIHFKPKKPGKHDSTVTYLSLGEGALQVALTGEASSPRPNGALAFTAPAKQPHTELLALYNITESPESYKMTTEVVSIEPKHFDGHYEFKHPTVVKSWGEAVAKCHWTFVCYEPCDIELKVVFTEEHTHDVQYYAVSAHVSPALEAGCVHLACRARESARAVLPLSNPLAAAALFTLAVSSAHVACAPQLLVPRAAAADVALVYSPLTEGPEEAWLEATAPDVGTRRYRLDLYCRPAQPRTVPANAPLGASDLLRLPVHNRTDAPAVFTATVLHPSILAEEKYTLDAQRKGKFMVYFEPVALGSHTCQVAFDSPTAGKFEFIIKGEATEPQPLGPYKIMAGDFTTITFKNIFEDTKIFKISVDVEHFYVKTMLETVASKKEIKIAVYMVEAGRLQDLTEPPVGCLVVEPMDNVGGKCYWTYFLNGIVP